MVNDNHRNNCRSIVQIQSPQAQQLVADTVASIAWQRAWRYDPINPCVGKIAGEAGQSSSHDGSQPHRLQDHTLTGKQTAQGNQGVR